MLKSIVDTFVSIFGCELLGGRIEGKEIPTTMCVCVCVCVCVLRTLNMRSTLLTNFLVHNTVLLTLGTMLYSRRLELIHFA